MRLLPLLCIITLLLLCPIAGQAQYRLLADFSPRGGTFAGPVEVTVTRSGGYTEVRYTFDGSDPTWDSPRLDTYVEKLTVDHTCILKIRSFDDYQGEIISAEFVITSAPSPVATPTFSPAGGSFGAPQSVLMSCLTTDAIVRYTTDGSDPTESSLLAVPGVSILVGGGTTQLRARAWKLTGWNPSAVAAADYVVSDGAVAATPAFFPDAGEYIGARDVQVRSATGGAAIHYTTNGAEPTDSDPVVPPDGIVRVTQTLVLKARAWKGGLAASPTKEAQYIITAALRLPPPSISPNGGTFHSPIIVSFTPTGKEDYRSFLGIFYGLDSEVIAPHKYDPTSFRLWRSAVVRASCNRNLTASEIVQATFHLVPMAPTFSVAPGTYDTPQIVQVQPGPASGTSTTVRYTVSGADPTESDPVIPPTGVVLDRSMTLKARVYAAGWDPGEIATAQYVFTGTAVQTPTLSLADGSYDKFQDVTINCAWPNATIHYTVNGDDPTENDPSLSPGGKITVDHSLTLKAKAWQTGYAPSGIVSADFVIRPLPTPEFQPTGGSYPEPLNVTVACAFPGVTIRYTTNGSDPTENDPVASVVWVDHSLVLKARAWKSGYLASAIREASYAIAGQDLVVTPSFTPDAGSYQGAESVTISCATPGVTIHYTTSGVDPTEVDPVIPSGSAVQISQSLTLKARAWKTGMAPSAIKSAQYVIFTETVATPAFAPAAGTYNNPQSISLTCETPGAVIHYTLNGATPIETDPIFADSLLLDQNTVVTARAWKPGFIDSPSAAASYAFVVATPSFSPDAGALLGPQDVTVTCATNGATIHYTRNGTDPTESDPVIPTGGRIAVDQALQIKARAWKSGWPASAIRSAAYTLVAAAPTFAPDGGVYNGAQNVVIRCETSGASIFYTTDGSDPRTTGRELASGGAVPVESNLTLKACARGSLLGPSAVKSADYVIRYPATLTLSLQQGWNMLSVPILPESGAWTDWTSALGGYSPSRAFSWDAAAHAYLAWPDPARGVGYWVKVASPVTRLITGYSAGTSSTIRLLGDQVGKLNLVGNPLAVEVPWNLDALRVKLDTGETRSLREAISLGWLRESGWVWDPQAWAYRYLTAAPGPDNTNSLAPGMACWLLSFRDCQILINTDQPPIPPAP